MKARVQILLVVLLIIISFIAGAFSSYTPAMSWIEDMMYQSEDPLPAMASVEVKGNVEIDLTVAGNRATALKDLYLSENNQQVFKTFEKLARQQAATTHYQTIYRDRGTMPLPFDSMNLLLGSASYDSKRNRITVPYTMEGYIVSPDLSLLESLPFNEITSEYTEILTVPADPTNLFQRLGYACANQQDIPLGQVDDANYGTYFDPECGPGVDNCRNLDNKPVKPCLDVLQKENGVGTISVHISLKPYDEKIAEKWQTPRDEPLTDGVDLTVNKDDLENYDIVYKKFEQNSCAIQEQCVNGPGVRRLLRFDGSVKNVGNTDLVFGEVKQLEHTHQFEFNACHMHNHFEGFASFSLEKDNKKLLSSRKQTFCVESTDRTYNDTNTSFTADYSCEDQGLKAGWEDEYFIGLDCQWIDITDLQIAGEKEEFTLSMEVNPLKLLCEGKPSNDKYVPAYDENGEKIFGQDGQQILKQACIIDSQKYANNKASVTVTIPKTGGSVNQPCDTVAFGPMKNCGWEMNEVRTCTPDSAVSLGQTRSDLVRACPDGVPCSYNDALVSAESQTAKFTCPKEGQYLLMTSRYY